MSGQFVHLGDFEPRADFWKGWERIKHRQGWWLAECFAEFVRALSGLSCWLRPDNMPSLARLFTPSRARVLLSLITWAPSPMWKVSDVGHFLFRLAFIA